MGDEGTSGVGAGPERPLPPLDPHALVIQAQRSRLPLRQWSIPFLAVLAIASVVFVISLWLDVLTATGEQASKLGFGAVLDSALNQDLEQARQTLGGLGEVMAAILGLALTVSSIIVQLAATRFTPHVTSLFFRARANLFVLGFFVVSNIFVLWMNFTVGESFLPHWGIALSMVGVTASLLLLFPYFAYVFYFLEPDSIISRITANGVRAAIPMKGAIRRDLEHRQRRAVESVEHLANIGLNAVQQKDKNIASGAVDALCTFGSIYGDTKAGMVREWKDIPTWNRQSPDFVSLSDEAIHDLIERGTWLEWKILRQYQMLFNEGLLSMKDLCYLIAINTRRLGESASRHGDMHALDLAIKFFNTYLRATVNASDIRTAYNILHQYRQLGEFVLGEGRAGVTHGDELDSRGLEIGGFMRYYSGIAFQRGLTFLTEVIAHDVGNLCEVAYMHESPSHRKLLDTFLRVDDTADVPEQETTLRGVRRAQVKLATIYLVHGDEAPARAIQRDMKDEPQHRLQSIWDELNALDSREFWEVNDRGTNFNYLSPEQKAKLPEFFSWFPALKKTGPALARKPDTNVG
jgi:hypothetical protein